MDAEPERQMVIALATNIEDIWIREDTRIAVRRGIEKVNARTFRNGDVLNDDVARGHS